VRFRVVDWSPDPSAAPLWSLPNVEVLPFARGEALQRAFASARVFFFPSRAETFGLVLAEAMASGCAIVSTVDVGFAGRVVGVGDVDAMTRAVRELWDDRDRAAEMGRENVERARGLTWPRYAKTLLSTYETLLGGGAATRPGV
jgi:glycosyltransferase involved in cell wall biosynthesis